MYRRSFPKLLWYRLTQWVVGGVARVYFRLRRRGMRNMPAEGPVVLLANHQSHLDPLLIGCFMPRPLGYLARDTLFKGILGPMIRAYDAIPIDRDGGGLAGIRATLKRIKQGDAVLMFPEGTRSQDGKLQPLKPGFIALVRRGKASIVPLGIAGSFEAYPRGKTFPSPRPVALVCGKAIPPEDLANLDDEALLDLVAERMADCYAQARHVAGYGLT
ncbi:1-acyl-sn-glycerol-3-phosphate acyltransferase [Aeoliella sp. ICT_H6.2]|uniref:1-acyl-sn-glycerol-3-phosphate acyltransferase n=1 Tax=Aeoliella straminimaris TaxID=2954799 RepID=A0A9X2JJQ4_9BACT|nr:lysophospholipid acyltransferase family protein [Aeoliella straminimaris]MCO6047023.1 1-acyl-sn-glycerol-3-phosphate acyltransferase [Aeoliella straminimaris]